MGRRFPRPPVSASELVEWEVPREKPTGWPGHTICAEGHYLEADSERRAAIFIGPDIEVEDAGTDQIRLRIAGVDVFDPSTGEVRSDNADRIATWFIDTEYNGESFFVRYAYFLGAGYPYKSLKTTLRAEIDEDAWSTLHSDVSRPFPRPTGCPPIAIPVSAFHNRLDTRPALRENRPSRYCGDTAGTGNIRCGSRGRIHV